MTVSLTEISANVTTLSWWIESVIPLGIVGLEVVDLDHPIGNVRPTQNDEWHRVFSAFELRRSLRT